MFLWDDETLRGEGLVWCGVIVGSFVEVSCEVDIGKD